MSIDMEAENFQQMSAEFMTWLKQQPGIAVSPKIQLADFGFRGAGRGVSM